MALTKKMSVNLFIIFTFFVYPPNIKSHIGVINGVLSHYWINFVLGILNWFQEGIQSTSCSCFSNMIKSQSHKSTNESTFVNVFTSETFHCQKSWVHCETNEIHACCKFLLVSPLQLRFQESLWYGIQNNFLGKVP